MTGSLWRIVVAVAILAHGIGHVLFLAPCLGFTQWGQTAHSWLLTRTVGETTTRIIGGVLWLAVTAGFLAAGVGLLGQAGWWRAAAVASAGVSLAALGLFASAIGTQPLLSAAVMDTAILLALVWLRWPAAELVGA